MNSRKEFCAFCGTENIEGGELPPDQKRACSCCNAIYALSPTPMSFCTTCGAGRFDPVPITTPK